MQKEELSSFISLKSLYEIRRNMTSKHGGRCPNSSFFDELESIISNRTLEYQWVKKPKEGVVKGDVRECLIGKFYHKRTVHIFTCLYAEYDPEQEVVIDSHGHEEKFPRGKKVKKIKEWYIFQDGKVEFCDKDELHQLVNDYGKPIYVISVKSMSNADH